MPDSDFEYIDLWSSTFTWGGGPVPQAGDLVVITEDIVLDIDTPVLEMLIIKGGFILLILVYLSQYIT